MRKLLGVVSAFTFMLSLVPMIHADEQAECRATIDKSIKAMGGAEKLTKYKAATWKAKGKFYGLGEGIDYTGEWAGQGVGQSRMSLELEVQGMKITQVNVINKGKGWLKTNDMVTEMTKEMIEEGKEQAYAQDVTSLVAFARGDKGFVLSPIGEAKVGDRPAVAIRVANKGHRDISLFFDKETSLLLKGEWRGPDLAMMQGEVTLEFLMTDYKDIDGTKQPMKFEIKQDGKLFMDGEMTEYKAVEKLDDSLFDKP